MSNETFLKEVKARFFRGVLADETLAQLVLTALSDVQDTKHLPDFMAEPWRPTNPQTGQSRLGLRFNMSATSNQAVLSATFATFQYLEVLTMTAEKSERTLLISDDSRIFFDASDAFMALDVPIEEKRRAALEFMKLWQQFCQTAEMLGTHIDPLSATFTTEVRSYCSE